MKATFSSRLADLGTRLPSVSESRRKHRESNVWQRRFWEHTIRDEDDLKAHLDYIHYNPVKHGLVTCPHAWRYSSFLRWVERGEYEIGWGCRCAGNVPSVLNIREPDSGAGEP